jgi:intracellular multiplication protein IcmP
MAAQQQGGGSQDQGSSDFLWISIILVGGIFATWYFAGSYISAFLYQIKGYEGTALQVVLNYWNTFVTDILHLSSLQIPMADLQSLITQIHHKKANTTFTGVVAASTTIGDYLRFFIAPVLVLCAVIVYKKSVGLRFKTVFDMNKMRAAEKMDWPQITPVIKLNLVKEDIDKGPWAMAMTPMQFCKKHKLLKEKTDDRGRPAVDLIIGKASQVFVTQLGPFWTQVTALPPYARALFAAFAACGNHDRDPAFELLNNISRSANTGKLDFTGADVLLLKHGNSKLAIKVMQHHAYVLTVFASMLELARTDGVFASSEFLWLKPLDRRLWYMLNTVGRQTPVPEAAGPFAHWQAEKRWGGPLRTPMVESAVKGLEVALSEILYEPEEAD